MFELLFDKLPYGDIAAIIIFSVASFTDFLDGKIARSTNCVTDFGKFADPLADKLLVMSAFICFVQLGITNAAVVMIILTRELAVTSLRLVASSKKIVIAANLWGKVKTVSQMLAVLFVLAVQAIKDMIDTNNVYILDYISQILIYVSVVLTIVSGVIYIYQNRNIIKEM